MITTEATNMPREHTAAPPQRLEATTARASAPGTSAEIIHGALGHPSLDELAQQDICAALLSTPGLDARHIEVVMTAAGVLLRGTVAHPDDRAWALRIARHIAAPRPVREALALSSCCEVDAPPHPAPRVLEAADAE